MKAYRLIIKGRVQGVWYRASAREKARSLGVMGWVRNMPDGAVEAHIQGENASLEDMISWCRQGPPGARVDAVDIEEVRPDAGIRSFEIRYE